jgi:U4/U6 small nuclear ribonucleoprotein PRP4
MPNLNPISTKRGHEDKIGGLAWHPTATLSASPDALNFASGGGEGTVKLWSLTGQVACPWAGRTLTNRDKPLGTLTGHTNRVGRIAFHPSGAYLGSASFDGTWRLWDVETKQELLIQEGHSKEVYALAFQDDGALAASGYALTPSFGDGMMLTSSGFDAIGRVWDIRTGRTAMVLDGHVKEILTMDFAPNG